ncbi:MAG: DEAD/DEAH box helicase, partial [Syntrophothermus sp.]
IYGGTSGITFSREQQAIKEGADILICTPGRLIAHINMGYVSFDDLKYLVLDEADRMLDMGFHDDIMKIISNLPKKRQTLLFSATMPSGIRTLAQKVLVHPEEISLSLSKPPENIQQEAFVVYDKQKIPLVTTILKDHKTDSILVFCSTKGATKDLARELKRNKFAAGEIHSDLDQQTREDILRHYKNRELKVLVATDILSRGIDIEDIDMVINFDVPHDAEDYIHRIGRTARAAASGIAITLISEKEQRKFKAIEDLLGKEVCKLPVPDSLGPAPTYAPSRKFGDKKKSFRKRK